MLGIVGVILNLRGCGLPAVLGELGNTVSKRIYREHPHAAGDFLSWERYAGAVHPPGDFRCGQLYHEVR